MLECWDDASSPAASFLVGNDRFAGVAIQGPRRLTFVCACPAPVAKPPAWSVHGHMLCGEECMKIKESEIIGGRWLVIPDTT